MTPLGSFRTQGSGGGRGHRAPHGPNGQVDLDVYQMGNHVGFHGYMHHSALASPGLLVLHDLSLFDFYAVACGGVGSPVLVEEAVIDGSAIDGLIPTLVVDGRRVPNQIAVPLSRRLIEASVLTVVHSGTIATSSSSSTRKSTSARCINR